MNAHTYRPSLRPFVAVLALSVLLSPAAHAQTMLRWDNTPTTAGLQDGAGNWGNGANMADELPALDIRGLG